MAEEWHTAEPMKGERTTGEAREREEETTEREENAALNEHLAELVAAAMAKVPNKENSNPDEQWIEGWGMARD